MHAVEPAVKNFRQSGAHNCKLHTVYFENYYWKIDFHFIILVILLLM